MKRTYKMEHFLTKEQYLIIKSAWANQSTAHAYHHIIYNILRSLPIDLGFVPFKPTNLNKIASNNRDRWNGFNQSLHQIYSMADFQDTSTEAFTKNYPKYWSADQIESRRRLMISDHSNRKASFMARFGVELTDELCQKLKDAIKDQQKK